MIRLKIKPLSVNEVWKGRRFKTPAYKIYEESLKWILPKTIVPKNKIYLKIKFGFSSKSSDIDNCLKPFIDILQKNFLFNDKMIYKLQVEKEITKKGCEFIEFKFLDYE